MTLLPVGPNLRSPQGRLDRFSNGAYGSRVGPAHLNRTTPPEMDALPTFEERYEHVAPALMAWASLRCQGPLGRALDAVDLVQEVCADALEAFGRFDPERGSFRAWVFGVAHRVATRLLRQLARGSIGSANAGSSQVDALPAPLTTLSRRLRRDESIQAFVEQLATLDEESRRLLVHRGLEGLSHEATAAILGLSEEAVAKRWQRLRDRIRQWPAATDVMCSA